MIPIVDVPNPVGEMMDATALRIAISRLPEEKPMFRRLEQAISIGTGYQEAWYRSQKEHWLGWLAAYDGPGAYGRATHSGRDAQFIYNHIQCAPMLFWLAEAVEVDPEILKSAFSAVIGSPRRGASQCGALRKIIPWNAIAENLTHGSNSKR